MKNAQMAKELTKIADQKGGKQVLRRFRRQRLMSAIDGWLLANYVNPTDVASIEVHDDGSTVINRLVLPARLGVDGELVTEPLTLSRTTLPLPELPDEAWT